MDLGVRGVWQPQAEALFDFKVIDTQSLIRQNQFLNRELKTKSGSVYKQAVERVLLHHL